MSKTRSKGTFAETAVALHLNLWYYAVSIDHEAVLVKTTGYKLIFDDALSLRYPAVMTVEQYELHPDWNVGEDEFAAVSALYRPDIVIIDPNSDKRDWEEEGLPFTRVPSRGSNDEGDVHGPFTAIEVKNHRNPSVNSLLSNAEWKAKNAGKPYWFLCYKADGKGYASIGQWHTMVTVEHLVKAYGLQFDIQKVGEYCYRNDVMRLDITNVAPGATRPKLPWSIDLVFTARMNGLEKIRDDIWKERYSFEERVIPIIISPRRTTEENYSLERWYAYSKLSGSCRVLETLGVLPQDITEYANK